MLFFTRINVTQPWIIGILDIPNQKYFLSESIGLDLDNALLEKVLLLDIYDLAYSKQLANFNIL